VSLRLVTDQAPVGVADDERQEQLLDELARVLARQIGEHPLPHELALRASAIERELAGLEDRPEAYR
jgi:hypothetical protein